MISGEKILITGVTGMVATPLAMFLAEQNEVWGLARFADPAARLPFEGAGITTRAIDLGDPDFSELPQDFTYVLHLSWMRADLTQLQQAIRTNVEGPGLLFQHCRRAKATLVMSGMGIYSPNPDPWHLYTESDPIGRGSTAYAPTSPATKAGIEAVARFCARAFDMRIVIARLNTFNGSRRSMPAQVIRAVLEGRTVHAPYDPNPQSPIHIDDIKSHLEAMLDAASNPATIVNWCGDEAVPLQNWARLVGQWSDKPVDLAVRNTPCAPTGSAADPTLRRSITGRSDISFEAGFRALYDEIVAQAQTGHGPNWGRI